VDRLQYHSLTETVLMRLENKLEVGFWPPKPYKSENTTELYWQVHRIHNGTYHNDTDLSAFSDILLYKRFRVHPPLLLRTFLSLDLLLIIVGVATFSTPQITSRRSNDSELVNNEFETIEIRRPWPNLSQMPSLPQSTAEEHKIPDRIIYVQTDI
jgi:hypothetical protein